jgi:hypothetical protein
VFKVYWTDYDDKPQALYVMGLNKVLKITEDLRKQGYTFVTMVSEDPNSVGKPGVDEIVEGTLPDGGEYSWRKRR